MIFIFRLFTFKRDGECRSALRSPPWISALIVTILLGSVCGAALSSDKRVDVDWPSFDLRMREGVSEDYRKGWAYIISGSLGFLSGLLAQASTADPLEKGVFILSQSIGIAAIGHGASLWRNGNEDRLLYYTLRDPRGLTDQHRTAVLKSYQTQRLQRDRNKSYIDAITFGLIGGLNAYNASQTQDASVKNALYFIGTINLLAAVSFSFP